MRVVAIVLARARRRLRAARSGFVDACDGGGRAMRLVPMIARFAMLALGGRGLRRDGRLGLFV
ncbi:MAG: hypothetical protein WAM99_16055, partial [Xanthobacteraceae bacterium]